MCSSSTTYCYAESSCAELILTRNAAREYPWHSHAKHWIIGMVCSGAVTFRTRDTSRELLQNDSFIVPPDVAHSLRVNAEAKLAILCLNAGESIGKNIGDLVESLYQAPGEDLSESDFLPSDITKLQELVDQLAEQSSLDCHLPALTPPIQAVVRMLQVKPEESHTLDEMAAVAGYSRWHFLRLFQKELGVTPHAYLVLCRLRLLRSLLRTDASTVEATLSTGFSDQSHMHRVFKLHHGLTPKQFREASISLGS